MTARIAVLLLLGGCASWNLTAVQCREMNWYERGDNDGRYGHPPQVVRLAQQCAQHGVPIAQAEYLKGWEAGHDEWDRLIGSYGQD